MSKGLCPDTRIKLEDMPMMKLCRSGGMGGKGEEGDEQKLGTNLLVPSCPHMAGCYAYVVTCPAAMLISATYAADSSSSDLQTARRLTFRTGTNPQPTCLWWLYCSCCFSAYGGRWRRCILSKMLSVFAFDRPIDVLTTATVYSLLAVSAQRIRFRHHSPL